MSKPDGLQKIIIEAMHLPLCIGVNAGEWDTPQATRLDVTLWLPDAPPARDSRDAIFDYDVLVRAIRDYAYRARHGLIETYLEHFAAFCFADPRIRRARLRLGKTTVYDDIASVAVEIDRLNPNAEKR